ncbi:MAG: cytochrome c biogenesis protein CcdA [Nitrospirae bacterium]|nr:MAG: cytochrome c biogenesis protein CcdA [Nitrospirota bacterium]
MIESLPQVSWFAAFSAGLLSFVSPCVLPLVPSYISYITGLSIEQLSDMAERRRFRRMIILNALCFIAGFSSVFIAFGASASFIGQVLYEFQDLIRKIGAVLIVIFGLYLLGVIKISFLMREHRFIHLGSRPVGYIGSFLIGTAFAAGWTPCVGPILGSILLYASTTESMRDGVLLLTAYSAGLGLPLLITAWSVDGFLQYFKKVRAYLWGVEMVSGACLVVIGAMIYMNSFTMLTSFLERHGIGWYIGQ